MEKKPLNIKDQWVVNLLAAAENEILDFKRVGNVSNVVKTACAMANGDGGHIVLGVGDQKQGTEEARLFGIEENSEALGEIKRAFVDDITPQLAPPETESPRDWNISIQKSDGSVITLVIIRIEKSGTVHSTNNATYLRFGSQNRQIGAQEIHRLCLRRGVESVVNQPVDVPVELLETEWWGEYARQRKLTRPFTDAAKHLGLVIQDKGKWKPTVGAVLLFAEEPNGLLNRKCAIRIFHYHGHEVEYGADPNLLRPPVTITGPVLKQIRGAALAVDHELNSGIQRTSQGFELKQKYPRQVVQEAITNAVLHRDYHAAGDIHIRIFTNRIEVESPGLFPGAITPQNIGIVGSKPRNPMLTDHVREFPNPPNLDAGEGVRMMRNTMNRMGLYPPVFTEITDKNKEAVLVRISNEAKLSEWELIKDHLEKHESISNKELRTMLNLSDNETYKASRLLTGWVESGLLRIKNPNEGTRHRKYVLGSSKELVASPLAINGDDGPISLIDKGLWNTLLAVEEAKRKKTATPARPAQALKERKQ